MCVCVFHNLFFQFHFWKMRMTIDVKKYEKVGTSKDLEEPKNKEKMDEKEMKKKRQVKRKRRIAKKKKWMTRKEGKEKEIVLKRNQNIE